MGKEWSPMSTVYKLGPNCSRLKIYQKFTKIGVWGSKEWWQVAVLG